MDTSIVPVLAFITLGLVCVWGYLSAVRSYTRARDPNEPKSSLAADYPHHSLLPPDRR